MPDIGLDITQHPEDADQDKQELPNDINMADLGEDNRAEWQRPKDVLKQHISNYVHILVYDERTDIAIHRQERSRRPIRWHSKGLPGYGGVLGPAFGPHAAFAYHGSASVV